MLEVAVAVAVAVAAAVAAAAVAVAVGMVRRTALLCRKEGRARGRYARCGLAQRRGEAVLV
jgi:hypothetical protein